VAGALAPCRGAAGLSAAAHPASGIGRERFPLAKRNFSVPAPGRSLGMHVPLKALALILKLTSGLRTLGEVPVG
jgi:hypothetical protein